jgi:serine/threonine-protein kinase
MTSLENFDASHLIGKNIGSSVIISELARGGMAIVFIAYQRSLKRRIAVKILPKILLTPRKAELFQLEAETAAILSHPNIVQILDVGDIDEFIFFTMQLIRGAPLTNHISIAKKQILPSKRFMPVKEIIKLFIQILDGLDYAHQQGIIHRDIKPDNIMIEKHTQRPIVTDFGVAKVLRDAKEDNSVTRGSPLYMSPEQIINESIDNRSDIYAAGIMLFETLVPELPLPKFESYDELLKHKLLNENGFFLKKPSDLNPFIDKRMDHIIQSATAYESEKRFTSCREFKNALQNYQKLYL